MQELKLELYQGPIYSAFQPLPGYTQIRDDWYWAVLMAPPPAGTAQADWIKPETPGPVYPEGTAGTQTLPVGTTQFVVSQVCVKHPKIPPYKYYPTIPNGPTLGPIPVGFGDPGLYCVTPPPNTDGIGIWIVRIEKTNLDPATQPELPVAPPGGRAVFPPNDLHTADQPLLIVRGESPGNRRCPDLGDITGNKSCFAPGETGTFTVAITDPDSTLCGYTWEFKNGATGQSKIRPSTTNSISVVFDNAWNTGNWQVTVSAVLCNAAPECGFSIGADHPYEFGLLATVCPVIDYLHANPDSQNPCTYLFEVHISGGYSGTRLVWHFGDGTAPYEQAVSSPVMTLTHPYSNVPANGAHVSVELAGMNVCCPPQSKETWITLPPGGCPGGGGGGGGGMSLCGFLLGMWLAAFVAAGILGYLNLWYPWGAIAYVAYGVFLAAWIAACCWPCARRFWKCCTLLQWHFIATSWLLQAFAALALASVFNAYVTAAYLVFAGTVLSAMLAIGRCRVPNIWSPRDYPGTKCEKNWW